MQLSGSEQFSQTIDELWERLTDFTLFVHTLPRVDKIERVESRLLECRVRAGLSFFTGTLRLKFETLDEQPPTATRMRITGKGVGASVVVENSIQLVPIDGGTELRWHSEVMELGGLLKPVGHSLIEAAAQKVIVEGWDNFRRELGAEKIPNIQQTP